MKMAELKNGLDIPAHGTIRLAPAGYHIMFTHLTKPLNKGEKVPATLTFAHAGPVTVDFNVEGVGAAGPAPMKGGAMGGHEDVTDDLWACGGAPPLTEPPGFPKP